MKKRYTEEQIVGFLRGAEAGMPIVELCRRYSFSKRVSIFGAANSVV